MCSNGGDTFTMSENAGKPHDSSLTSESSPTLLTFVAVFAHSPRVHSDLSAIRPYTYGLAITTLTNHERADQHANAATRIDQH